MTLLPWHTLPQVNTDPHARSWLSFDVEPSAKASTVLAYARGLDHFLAFCHQASLRPADVGPDLVRIYVLKLQGRSFDAHGAPRPRMRGLANASIRQRLTILRRFYDYLVVQGIRDGSPLARGNLGARFGGVGRHQRSPGPALKGLPWVPGDDQWHAVLAAARSEPLRNRLMLALAYNCAMSREELCSLATSDVDQATQTLTIRAGTTRARVVPYSATTGALYAAYLAERDRLGAGAGPLFVSGSTRNLGAPLTAWTWSKVVRRIGLRAGLAGLRTQTFRHLRLISLVRAGLDAHHIAAFAGHRHFETTLLCFRLSGRDLVGVIKDSPDRRARMSLRQRLEQLERSVS